MKSLLLISLSLVAGIASSNASAQSVPWKISQPAWNENHEKTFGEFVAQLGDAVEKRKCNRVDTCMKSAANPFFKSDPAGLTYYADCADLPYYLRGYFAWKNQLPFSMISKMQPNPMADGSPSDRDIRYSSRGNAVVARYDIMTTKSLFKTSVPSALTVLNKDIPGYTFTANFRNPGTTDSNNLYTDFYPVKLNRQGVRPGTVIYDPNGHVAIVYKVTDDGRVFYIDAHPDNTLTMGLYTPKFVRSNPLQGAGFKRFRPLSLVDAKLESNGLYTGGSIVGTPNAQLKDYGTEQFVGTVPDPAGNWNKGKFTVKGATVNYYDYVRMSLTLGEQHIDPLSDMEQLVADICVSLQDRVAAVDGARTSGIDKKPHPLRLPHNIYGTDGEWENYSTPSRDARLKVSFMDLLDQTKRNLEGWKKRDPTIKYNGGNLAQDLYNVYAEKAKACQFSYTTSNGKTVTMNLEAGRQRLFAMSFDPYNCIERRWGARLPEELASCRDDANKTAWYNQEQWLRNQWERRYDARMDFSLEELTGPKTGAGIAESPDIDVVNYLRSQM